MKCHELGGDQEWIHRQQSKVTAAAEVGSSELESAMVTTTAIYNKAAGLCLGLDEEVSALAALGQADASKRLRNHHSDNTVDKRNAGGNDNNPLTLTRTMQLPLTMQVCTNEHSPMWNIQLVTS